MSRIQDEYPNLTPYESTAPSKPIASLTSETINRLGGVLRQLRREHEENFDTMIATKYLPDSDRPQMKALMEWLTRHVHDLERKMPVLVLFKANRELVRSLLIISAELQRQKELMYDDKHPASFRSVDDLRSMTRTVQDVCDFWGSHISWLDTVDLAPPPSTPDGSEEGK